MKSVEERIHSLESDEQQALERVVLDLLETLESNGGAAVLVMDKQGDGRAVIVTLGNTRIVQPLLASATSALAQVATEALVLQ